ncbi:MAG: 3-keto-5-aminohexanoate cleavage protein [Oscillospiraceae bacterium]|nr:3-keto-5-aminohexanoate cleavage protein [Oscillospiraceae bacterium]
MAKKIIITAALTGTTTPKHGNPNLPTTPAEIAQDAYNCWKAGAAIVHLHMRDDNTAGTMEAARFKETIDLIRAHKDCDVIINCTSSGTAFPLPNADRMVHFNTIPEIEMGTYDVGTINWACMGIFENSPGFLRELAKCYDDNGVLPEVEMFDMGMISNMKYYREHGVLNQPLWCQLVLGVLGGAPATVACLEHLVRHLPEDAKWSAFGIGKDQLPIMYAALALGADGIRVGMEDNLWFSKGVQADNPMQVERAVRVVKEFDRVHATSAETREILGMKPFVR